MMTLKTASSISRRANDVVLGARLFQRCLQSDIELTHTDLNT